ncbi:MAG: hydrogenase maturation protease [Candidatus Omnitrophica bacterium]|nr:hydrogenase maturation protease [Candidatus Omnitrophota bacterium]
MDVKILVAGLGNTLMKDDGIGVYLSRYLKTEKIKGIQIQEIGVEDWRVPCIASGFKDVVLIDAVDMEALPGQIVVWEDVDFVEIAGISLHTMSFISELSLVRALKKLPKRIFLFGIQPEKIDWGIGLTDSLNNQFFSIAGRLKNFVESLV